MKNRLLSVLVLAAMAMTAASPVFQTSTLAAEASVKIYVSPDGDDTDDGSEDFPLKTLQGAKSAIKLAKSTGMPEGGIEVIFREGNYNVGASGFELNVDQSGEEGKPIVYKAYEGEKVIFSGDVVIENSDFQRVTDESDLERLPESAQDKVYYVDADTLGLSLEELGKIFMFKEGGGTVAPTFEMYFNDEPMTVSRWPNRHDDDNGYVKYGQVVGEPGEDGFVVEYKNEEKMNRWVTADQMLITGYWYTGYLNKAYNAVVDADALTITASGNGSPGAIKDGRKFYAYNLLEELDEPGEFFVDRKTGRIYIYPTSAIELANISYSNMERPLMTGKNVQYITFDGITFQNCADAAFTMNIPQHQITRSINVINCTIRNIGKWGFETTYLSDLRDSVFADNHMYNIGSFGLNCNGSDRKTVTKANNVFKNNHVHNWSRYSKSYSNAFHYSGCGNDILNNVCHNSVHCVTTMRSSESLYANNEFYDLVNEGDDAGCIYTGRTWLTRGIKIDNNYFHDITSPSGRVNTLYFDDMFSGDTVISNNIFHNVASGIGMAGGNTFTVDNNLFVGKAAKGSFSIQLGVRLDSWWHLIREDLAKDDFWKSGEYAENYPRLLAQFDENLNETETTFLPQADITNNIVMRGRPINIAAEAEKTNSVILNNYETNDILNFADYDNRDFTLTEEDVKKYPNFKPIDFYGIGIQPSEYNEKTFLERILEDAIALKIDSPNALVDNEKKMVDKDDASVMPTIKDGRTLVPLRFIAESLGAEVDWNEAAKKITMTVEKGTIELVLNQTSYNVNGNEYALDVPAQIISGRTMVPVRAISEMMGKKVFWDPRGLVIIGQGAVADLNATFDKFRMSQLEKML